MEGVTPSNLQTHPYDLSFEDPSLPLRNSKVQAFADSYFDPTNTSTLIPIPRKLLKTADHYKENKLGSTLIELFINVCTITLKVINNPFFEKSDIEYSLDEIIVTGCFDHALISITKKKYEKRMLDLLLYLINEFKRSYEAIDCKPPLNVDLLTLRIRTRISSFTTTTISPEERLFQIFRSTRPVTEEIIENTEAVLNDFIISTKDLPPQERKILQKYLLIRCFQLITTAIDTPKTFCKDIFEFKAEYPGEGTRETILRMLKIQLPDTKKARKKQKI